MLRLHCDAKVACTVLSRSGFGIDTWNGTSRMLRQMPSSVPEIAVRAALAARRLDPENPDCHNRPEYGQTGDSPACCVGAPSVSGLSTNESFQSLMTASLQLGSGACVFPRRPKVQRYQSRPWVVVPRLCRQRCQFQDGLFDGKRAGRADQLVGFEKNVGVGRLLPRKEADRHKRGATQQPHEHDLSVSTPVRIVKRAGHRPSQAAAHQAHNRTHILTLLMRVTATCQFEQSLLDRGRPALRAVAGGFAPQPCFRCAAQECFNPLSNARYFGCRTAKAGLVAPSRPASTSIVSNACCGP